MYRLAICKANPNSCMIYEWVAFLDTLDNPQGAHEGLAHTLELIEMRWYHMIKICPFFHIVRYSRYPDMPDNTLGNALSLST